MRKTLLALSALPLIALATPASAQTAQDRTGYYYGGWPWVAGAATGTVVGVGLTQGWFGSGAFAASLPASAAGAAAVGGVAGVGTVALIDAAVQPCAGFRALMSPFLYAPGQSGCVDGQYVGERAATVQRTRIVERAAPRRRY
jgi:hypothetical protein